MAGHDIIVVGVSPGGVEAVPAIVGANSGDREDPRPDRCDNPTRLRYRGLSLAIIKQLVEMHRGSIRAKSPGEGQGPTITVSLPESSTRSSGSGPTSEARAARRSIGLSRRIAGWTDTLPVGGPRLTCGPGLLSRANENRAGLGAS
jgi:hypothetical protein